LKNWKHGNPNNSKTLIGPLINQKAVSKVDELVNDAIKKGAKKIIGGTINGLFYPVTVLDKVTKNMKIYYEEIFGPVMPIIRVKNNAEAVRVSNSSNYALDSSIFTKDLDKAKKIALKLEEGSVHINKAPSHGIGYFPFGGNKDSGIYREGINESIQQMMRKKSIVFSSNNH